MSTRSRDVLTGFVQRMFSSAHILTVWGGDDE